jgi:acyl-coenzyme A thioesterase PaaI-like protein
MSAEPSAAGRALANELRALVSELVGRDNSDAALADALGLVRTARATLDGFPRSRWAGAAARPDGQEARAARQRHSEHTLYRGEQNPLAAPLRITFETQDDGTAIAVGRVRCGPVYEGPPGGVHGGYVAGLFDDVLGSAQALVDGPTGLTGTLSVKYRQLTPLNTDLVIEAWIERVSGRRIVVHGTCSADGRVTANAEALFVRVDLVAMAARAGNG